MSKNIDHIKNQETKLRLLRHAGQSGYTTNGTNLDNAGRGIQAKSHGIDADASAIEADAITTTNTEPALVNPDPLKPAVRYHKPPTGFKRWWMILKSRAKFQWSVLFPKPTEEELHQREEENKVKNLFNQMLADTMLAYRIMSSRWQKLMFYDKVREGSEKPNSVRKVKFDVIAFDPSGNFIEFHVDTRPEFMPDDVFLTDLLSQRVTNELQYSLDKPIKTHANVWGGIVRFLRSGDNGLATFISIQEMWAAMPKNLPLLAWPVGRGENGRPFYKDLDDCPHLLVVGSTKMGKSNAINSIICTYLYRGLTPNKVQFVLFDCKNGMEFSFYDKLPHLFKDPANNIPGVIERLEQSVPALTGLLTVMNQRMTTIKRASCKNMTEYNLSRRRTEQMPALVVVFDDYISMSLVYGKQADDPLTILVSQCRAAGMYIILGAQYPKASQVPSLITVNFPVVIAFRLKPAASQAMIGSQAASEMGCAGRAVYVNFDEEVEVQTPRIADSAIKEMVHYAITGKQEGTGNRIDIEEVLGYAIEHFEGRLDHKKLYNAFRGKIGANKLVALLASADENIYNVNGTLYLVTMKQGRPRRMVLPEEIDIPVPLPEKTA
jgi:hypothetical protein